MRLSIVTPFAITLIATGCLELTTESDLEQRVRPEVQEKLDLFLECQGAENEGCAQEQADLLQHADEIEDLIEERDEEEFEAELGVTIEWWGGVARDMPKPASCDERQCQMFCGGSGAGECVSNGNYCFCY